MAKIRITQIKSKIDRPENQKRNLEALGLRKMNQTVEQADNAAIRGMINKVYYMVSVEE